MSKKSKKQSKKDQDAEVIETASPLENADSISKLILLPNSEQTPGFDFVRLSFLSSDLPLNHNFSFRVLSFS